MKKFCGYSIDCENGVIRDLKNGNEKKINNGKITIITGGKRRTLSAGRIVMEAYTGETLSGSDIVRYKDGDVDNIRISNMYIEKRSALFKKKYSKKKLSIEQEEEIRKLYSRKKQREEGFKGPSYTQLAKMYDVSKSTILKVLNNKYSQ